MPSNFYFNRNISPEAHEVMGALATAGQELRWIAFPPGGGNRFSIVTNQTFFNRNIPQECHDQMVAFLETGQQIVCVAFPPTGESRFSIVTNQTFFNRNIPQECHDQMVAFLEAGQKLLCVAFPPGSGDRFSIISDQTFFNRSVPEECHEAMVAMKNDGHKLLAVAFPPQGGNRFSIISDRGFFNRNVPEELHEKMGLMLCSRAPFRCVAFDADGSGWSVIAGGPTAQPSENDVQLQLTGNSTMTNSDLTQVDFSTTGQIENLTKKQVELDRAQLLFTTRGGWAYDIGDVIATKGNLYGAGPTIAPEANLPLNMGSSSFTAPVTNWLFRLHSTAGSQAQDHFAQFPIVRPGFSTPAALPTQRPVMISLQEPVEVLTLGQGEVALILLGQLINGTGRPINLKAWHLRIDWGGDVIYDQDLTETFIIINHPAAVIPFLYGIPIPSGFTQGALTLSGFVEVDGVCYPVHRQAPVLRANADVLTAPVVGRWKWGNGPGELVFQPHYGAPEQRYAYDMVILKEVNGSLSTFDGDENNNESFFCWNQPILAVADGTVVEVIDDVPDNFGRTFNPANDPLRNAFIIVQHPGNKYSLYAHVRQGTAEVTVGQSVTAGQVLGRVGNAGSSSEPHLHFDYRSFDSTGRARGLPMAFNNLTDVNGNSITGVPKGGLEYLSVSMSALSARRYTPRQSAYELSHQCCTWVPIRGGLAQKRPRGPNDVNCGMVARRFEEQPVLPRRDYEDSGKTGNRTRR